MVAVKDVIFIFNLIEFDGGKRNASFHEAFDMGKLVNGKPLSQAKLAVKIVIPPHASHNLRQRHLARAALFGIIRSFLALFFSKTFGASAAAICPPGGLCVF
ncbi:hypothetical protein U14_03579 [Candidatus Moduliflexus flocculans]|uniref:Uncharacterized protein n=1 Tax=Candidatus Moduliflexus flocculans TaxID=1499966 RepID=A0A081BPL2_9BACT|nr:hypothetical protein U14_03579 [Candidatus Moduliflexus flocculans]